MSEVKNSYPNVFFVSPYLYVSVDELKDGNDKLGRVLLYVFVVARQKNVASQMNIAQKFISFKKDNDGDTTIVSFDTPGTPVWVETIGKLSSKQSIFFVPIVIPEKFWEEPEEFTTPMLNKISSDSLNAVLNLSFDTYNTILLDSALDFCPIIDDRAVFKLKQDFEVIKIQKNQLPKER